jgi:hypothetical protein
MDMGALGAGEIMLLGQSEPPTGSSRAACGGPGRRRLKNYIIISYGYRRKETDERNVAIG